MAAASSPTHFLHDVVDPGRRAVADVGALGIPVALLSNTHVCSYAWKTHKHQDNALSKHSKTALTFREWAGRRGLCMCVCVCVR